MSRTVETDIGHFKITGHGHYFDNLSQSSLGHIAAVADLITSSHVVFDVGANIGATALYMKLISPGIRIYCF